MEVPIEACVSAKVYRPDSTRRMILLAVLVAMYAVSIPFCYYTAGHPRKAAMIHSQKIADEKWALESATMVHDEESQGAATPHQMVDIESSRGLSLNEEHDRADEFVEDDMEEVQMEKKAEAASSGWLMSWFGPSKEQRRAKAEFDKWQKELKEKSGDVISLPPEYLPSAWACLSLFASLSLHALFYLMCHWVVAFKAAALFAPSSKLDGGDFVLVVPPPNRGSAALVPVLKGSAADAGKLQSFHVEFQRQKYVYTPSSKLGEQAKKYPNGIFTLSAYPVALPTAAYLSSGGIATESDVQRLTEKWGKNHLAVAIPSFLELLQAQLLSPLAIFQIFCALLWLLDEYWSYTVFSLVSVVIYEATTVFQRTRTQQMLGGMAPKPTPIYAFRSRKWMVITTKDLLPGDIISLSFKKRSIFKANLLAGGASAQMPVATGDPKVAEDQEEHKTPITSRDEIIPCDCLLLKGTAVVNEASLTGESVPQMKESLAVPVIKAQSLDEEVSDHLEMMGAHRVNTLFSGSSIITVTSRNKKSDSKESEDNSFQVPDPPDHGAIAYVLRTGCGSSQGSLLQMIEFSQQSVSGDTKETGMALFLLFIFALMASGYVLKEGLRKKEKTTHELLLRCVIIITSVVPRQFPMQMAVAVNMALMALNKAGVFCTEPYRVPLAGKVSHCLFDKTGTITTDQLMPAGIINFNSSNSCSGNAGSDAGAVAENGGDEGDYIEPQLSPVPSANAETALILAACHSLVIVDDEEAGGDMSDIKPPSANLIGDPIELAAIKAIDWSWDGVTSTATPDAAHKRHIYGIHMAKKQLQKLRSLADDMRLPTHMQEQSKLEAEIRSLELKAEQSRVKAASALFHSVHVMQRHHFTSALQRMSVVVKCSNQGNSKAGDSSSSSGHQWYCLVKGSPEALKTLIIPAGLPSWYADTYERLARAGLRVLALAYKSVSAKERPHEQPRSWVESDLLFGGFIAFECKVRADSSVVIQSLIQADHKVMMLTGDALLTSLHVAKHVHICEHSKPNLTLNLERSAEAARKKSNIDCKIYWKLVDKKTERNAVIAFELDKVPELAAQYNLLTTEEAFLGAVESTGGKASPMWRYAEEFKVFSRMSPQGKANVIHAIQDVNKDYHVFMCGDGGNDVGALKQADVGLALLAGHANANTSDDLSTNTNSAASGANAEDVLNEHQKKLTVRNEALNKARTAHMKDFQARYQREQQAVLQEEIRKRTERGEYMAMFTLMKEQAGKMKQAVAEENMRFMALHGQVWDPKTDGDGVGGGTASKTSIEQLMESMDGAESGGLPMVRPGDASVAAPFTSRIPSIRAVVDLIRQGRCTLLSALMQQQIMMLESIISAYTLSALSLHNARSSERQMMASSWLVLTAAVSFSYASPVDHMHPLRPLRSLFNPAIIISIFGQALIHIACMSLAVSWATEAMGPEKLQEVTDFFKKAKNHEIDRSAHCGEDDVMCQMQAYWMAPFLPNLLNSVVFLVETSQMISVFFANYKGRPWMKGMMENHPLFLSVFACIGGVIVAAWELVPQLNEMIQLAPFPDDFFRYKVLLLVIATIIGTFLWDRFCVMMFAPKIFKATLEEFKKLSWRDFVPIGTTLLKVAAVLIVLGTGNILFAGLAFWFYRSYSNKPTEQAVLQNANRQ